MRANVLVALVLGTTAMTLAAPARAEPLGAAMGWCEPTALAQLSSSELDPSHKFVSWGMQGPYYRRLRINFAWVRPEGPSDVLEALA
jgi:hypothetical protein